MSYQEDIRDELLSATAHVRAVFTRLQAATGFHNRPFTFADAYKLTEGLLLSSWTQWEEFLRSLIVADLSSDKDGAVRRDVRRFRIQGAPRRLAELVLEHPDAPERYVEWDYDAVKNRADALLPQNHRFTQPLPRQQDLHMVKRMRNAIAHKSDKAWTSFRKLAAAAPFNLQPRQFRGLTVGRFLYAHQWNGGSVMVEVLNILDANVRHLVP
jgi:hypothetical protein